MSNENKFVDGLMVKQPHSNAPDFIKASISIKNAELIAWLQGQQGEWINIDIKESKGGKWYAAVNDFKPEHQGGQSQPPPAGPDVGDGYDPDSIPF